MDPMRYDRIHQLNYLTSEMNALYHQASLKLGISDSISVVLYTIYDAGDACPLSDIYKKSGISKQTVNSAIRRLEADGILYLEPYTGRSKKVILTEQGRAYVKQTVARLYDAEAHAFASWSDEEIDTYIFLVKKYAGCLQQQIEQLEG